MFVFSCERQFSYLPSGKKKHIHYKITFIDKEKKLIITNNHIFLKESKKNKSILVRSDGKVMSTKKSQED